MSFNCEAEIAPISDSTTNGYHAYSSHHHHHAKRRHAE